MKQLKRVLLLAGLSLLSLNHPAQAVNWFARAQHKQLMPGEC